VESSGLVAYQSVNGGLQFLTATEYQAADGARNEHEQVLAVWLLPSKLQLGNSCTQVRTVGSLANPAGLNGYRITICIGI